MKRFAAALQNQQRADRRRIQLVRRALVGVEQIEVLRVAEIGEQEKAVVEIPSPQSGRIAELRASVGDIVAIGTPLVSFEEQAVADSGTIFAVGASWTTEPSDVVGDDVGIAAFVRVQQWIRPGRATPRGVIEPVADAADEGEP